MSCSHRKHYLISARDSVSPDRFFYATFAPIDGMLAKLWICVQAPSRCAGGIIRSMRELKALTGLRAIAAIWVLFFHSSFSDLSFVPSFVSSLMSAGFAAVSLFFVLSGFILTYNYFPLEDGSQSRTKPGRYFVARFARIYPVYVLAFVLGAIAQGQLLNPANDPLPPWWLNVDHVFWIAELDVGPRLD